jgi:hypothetical protein
MSTDPTRPHAERDSARKMCRELYHALIDAGHASRCQASLSVGYDEKNRVWIPQQCNCGRNLALDAYERWRNSEQI